MAINPKTLRVLRERMGFSQKDLADQTRSLKGAAVSKRQIGRIESGETPAEGVRRHTVESLAKALRTTVDRLTAPLGEILSHDTWQWQVGYHSMKIQAVVLPDTPLSYKLVTHHYGVTTDDLIDAAPWMFTLLAELSLVERRRRLKTIKTALTASESEHLADLMVRSVDEACQIEEASIAGRDIFGRTLPFDFDITNPLIKDLADLARRVGSDAIVADACVSFPENRTCWPVFDEWCAKLTNGDAWARHAIAQGHARIDDIPGDLRSDERAADRAAWLAAKVPSEERALVAREEEERGRYEEEMNSRIARIVRAESR